MSTMLEHDAHDEWNTRDYRTEDLKRKKVTSKPNVLQDGVVRSGFIIEK